MAARKNLCTKVTEFKGLRTVLWCAELRQQHYACSTQEPQAEFKSVRPRRCGGYPAIPWGIVAEFRMTLKADSTAARFRRYPVKILGWWARSMICATGNRD
jgi:hypothetical protein